MWRVRCSRAINRHIFGGLDEMLCSRAYREGWRTVWLLDLICFWSRGWHCQQMYNYEVADGLLEKINQASARTAQEASQQKQTSTSKGEALARIVDEEYTRST